MKPKKPETQMSKPAKGKNSNQTDLHEKTGEPPSSSATNDYDPYLHRNVKHPTNNVVTLILLIKGLIGTGVFAIPNGFKQAGYIVAPICTVLIAIIVTYCFHILIHSMHVICKRHRIPVLTYPMAFKLALEDGPPIFRRFSPYAVAIVNTFLLMNQIGTGCVYVVFVASNLKASIDTWYEMKVEYYILILLVPLMCIMSIQRLNALAPFTIFATFICVTAIIIILVDAFTDMPPISERRGYGSIFQFPLFFGTALFALVPIGLIVTLENNMKMPQSFVSKFGVLNLGMTVVTTVYIIFGVVGYLKYGDQIKDSITLNLNPHDPKTKAVQMVYSVSIGLSYALQCYVAVEIIWGNHLSKSNLFSNHPTLGEYAVRLGIVLLTFSLAISIPKIGIYISLVGAFVLSIAGLVIPPLIHISMKYPFDYGPYNYKLIPNITLIVIGFCALITGTTTSMIDIIKFMSS